MLKFIKWELRDYSKKRSKLLIFISVVYILMLLAINTNAGSGLLGFIAIPFNITLFAVAVMVFVEGTRLIINTYKKKTFLLESMIAYSPAKLLLTKYLIAIIINIVYSIIMLAGFAVIMSVAGFEGFRYLGEALSYLSTSDIIKSVILIFVVSVNFTALIVLSYILAKCITKNKKGSVLLGIVIWWVITYIESKILEALAQGFNSYYIITDNMPYLIVIVMNLALLAIYYFATVKLIKDKLEVYS